MAVAVARRSGNGLQAGGHITIQGHDRQERQDNYGGQPHIRMLWDTASTLGFTKSHNLIRSLSTDGEMEAMWHKAGLIDVTTGGGATSSDTSSWASLVNVPFLFFELTENTIPFSLRVDSPLHASTLTMVCYLRINEAAGGTLSAEASNASITAVQTTVNG